MASKKYRVLVDLSIEGIRYGSNDVVILDDATAKAYGDQGALDGVKEAVGYCEGELGTKAKDHAALAKAAAAGQTKADDGV